MSGPDIEGVLPANADTLLVISGFGNMLYQARGLTQTLEPIGAASQLERTINGVLTDLSAPQFRKYTSKISVPSDVEAPPLENVWPGLQVTVECVCELAYPAGRSGSPEREEVSGSSRTENGFVFYRPVLAMRIKSMDQQLDEWKRQTSWSLELEEI